ncbi:MAG TPA: serine/threonine-protein kinase, partial [Thermoanaerobaculia bacterium]|nr:serine/threonine-protein kinase [Thermoanaerobaculia bacterium]
MSLAPGAALGRYRIVRRLGAGAMGEVYLAEDPAIERRLALKTVRLLGEQAMSHDELKARLLREAKAAGRLVHPYVVTLFDAGEAEGVFYLAFEFIDGPDLAQRMRAEPPLTLGEVLRIGRQAAEGLDAAHRRGIVHRDIKPSNILLDEAGQVKVTDFGIAKMVGQQTELTQAGSVVGSPHYLSPEQIRGDELDGRSDLFSLGVVLYEVLSRRRPFEGDTITTLVYQILSREPVPLAEVRSGLPPRLERIVSRLLAKERDARFATAAELAEELAGCERELSEGVLDGTAAPPAEDMDDTVRLGSGSAAAAAVPPPPPPAAAAATGTAPPPPPPAAAGPAPTARSSAGRWVAAAAVAAALLLLLAAGGVFLWLMARDDGSAEQAADGASLEVPAGATGDAGPRPGGSGPALTEAAPQGAESPPRGEGSSAAALAVPIGAASPAAEERASRGGD